MPASTPASPTSRRPAPLRDDGVSEVVGHLLILAIVSVLLILSMLAFAQASAAARQRVVELRAESAAARVSGVVVQTSLVAEQQGNATRVRFLVDLPQHLEGQAYQVRLVQATAGVPAHVLVMVPALNLTATATLFSADAPMATSGFDLCPSVVPGGRVNVRFDLRASVPGGCAGTRLHALYLETAP